jgi:hypothetical protein
MTIQETVDKWVEAMKLDPSYDPQVSELYIQAMKSYTTEILQAVVDGLPDDAHVADAGGSPIYDAGWNDCKKITNQHITKAIADLLEAGELAEGKPAKLQFELVEITKPGESYLPGGQLLERARELGIASGQEDADYLLEHQNEIPEAWRSWYLVFPKYVRDVYGGGGVAAFSWSDEERRWVLCFDWLVNDFDRYVRFVRRSE